MPQEELPESISLFISRASPLVYALLYFMMCFFTITTSLINIWVDSLFASFCYIAASHLRILRERILRTTEQFATNYEVLNGLKQCVEHHKLILEYESKGSQRKQCFRFDFRFTNEIERLYSYVCLGQYLGSILSICVTVFNVAIVS